MRVVSLEQAIIHARGHEPRHLTQPWHLAAHVLPPRYLSISISTAHLLPPPHLTPFCVVYRVIALRACIRSASLRMYSTRSGASHPPEADIARVRRYCQRRGHGLVCSRACRRTPAGSATQTWNPHLAWTTSSPRSIAATSDPNGAGLRSHSFASRSGPVGRE